MNAFSMKTGIKRPFRGICLNLILMLVVWLVPQDSGLAVSGNQAQEEASAISVEEFTRGGFAQAFESGDYTKALEELKLYLQKYPSDPLLLRYQAITYSYLGENQKSVGIFKRLLENNPNHAPTHYFLGQTYYQMGEYEAARNELQWIVNNAPDTPYGTWAKESLEEVRTMGEPVKTLATKPLKRWIVDARYGYEFDTNVILSPDDKGLTSSRDKNAGRHKMSLDMSYRIYSRRDLAVDLEYGVSQSLHDDSLNEFNFHSEEFGVNARKRVKVLGQDATIGARYQFLSGYLDGEQFTLQNAIRLSADTRFSRYTRSILSYDFSATNIGPDGFNPSQTSRDGFSQQVGVSHYLFSKDYRRFVYVYQALTQSQTRGFNFDYAGTISRVGVHTPLAGKLSLDVSAGYQYRNYHNFESLSFRDQSERRNHDWDIYSALAYPITSNVSIRAIYRFISAGNRNNFYDYSRHIIGGEIRFREAF